MKNGKPERMAVMRLSEIKSVKVVSHKDEVLNATDEAIEKALILVGIEWQGKASAIAPVVTGRLSGSINYATVHEHGDGSPTKTSAVKSKDYATRATPRAHTVVVGTNVEYAEKIEEGGAKEPKHSHYLRNSLTNNVDLYKKIIESELKGI